MKKITNLQPTNNILLSFLKNMPHQFLKDYTILNSLDKNSLSPLAYSLLFPMILDGYRKLYDI